MPAVRGEQRPASSVSGTASSSAPPPVRRPPPGPGPSAPDEATKGTPIPPNHYNSICRINPLGQIGFGEPVCCIAHAKPEPAPGLYGDERRGRVKGPGPLPPTGGEGVPLPSPVSQNPEGGRGDLRPPPPSTVDTFPHKPDPPL